MARTSSRTWWSRRSIRWRSIPDEAGDLFNEEFFNRARNQLATVLPESADYTDCLKVIHVPDERPGYTLEINMDGERALAYFDAVVDNKKKEWKSRWGQPHVRE